MNRNLGLGIGAAAAAGLLGLGLLSKARRERIGNALSHRMLRRMERMMARLPENSPPRLVMSVLPQLREQNDEIIRLLREQNALLSANHDRTSGMNPQAQDPVIATSGPR
jgi:hypothetical protein